MRPLLKQENSQHGACAASTCWTHPPLSLSCSPSPRPALWHAAFLLSWDLGQSAEYHARLCCCASAGNDLARLIRNLDVYGDNVRAALIPGVAHPNAMSRSDGARALMKIGGRDVIEDSH
jgi:hypothetical protein